jgi:hypothetical protein
MNQFDPFHIRRAAFYQNEPGKQPGFLNAPIDTGKPVRNLRMIVAGLVQLIPFIV